VLSYGLTVVILRSPVDNVLPVLPGRIQVVLSPVAAVPPGLIDVVYGVPPELIDVVLPRSADEVVVVLPNEPILVVLSSSADSVPAEKLTGWVDVVWP